MWKYEDEIDFKRHPAPEYSLVLEEMEKNSGFKIETRALTLNFEEVKEGAVGFEIVNDPSNAAFCIYFESDLITISARDPKIGYFEGVLKYILIDKFKGEVSSEPFLPPWTREAWKGEKWWRKCKKSPSLSFLKGIKIIIKTILKRN